MPSSGAFDPAAYATFDAVCELLQAGHRKGSNTPSETLNRLFGKHLSQRAPALVAGRPLLDATNTSISVEWWPKARISELAFPDGPAAPRRVEVPVVVVRYRGRDCLLDGNNRARHWRYAGDPGEHPVCLLVCRG